jgi:hypothetical protein
MRKIDVCFVQNFEDSFIQKLIVLKKLYLSVMSKIIRMASDDLKNADPKVL